jgi:DNA-binding MarR family transcriptional regulator
MAPRIKAKAATVPVAPAPVASDEGPRDLGMLKQVMGFRFRRIQNHLSRSLSQREEFQGHKAGELSVLAIIEANPGLSQIALANEVGMDKAVMVVVIDDLEKRGWVKRERAPEDRRRNLLYITKEGVGILSKWIALARENERPVRETLSDAEFAILSELLDRIYNKCFNHVED